MKINTRLRSDKHCWDEIKAEMKKRLDIPLDQKYLCTSKMLRKTFTHKTKCMVLCMVRVLQKWRKMKVLIIIMVACKEYN